VTPEETKDFRKATYRAAQKPSSWLDCAKRLRDAAEIIFVHEGENKVLYLQACAAAVDEALTNGSGTAEVRRDPPNYLPAQMLCSFALENAFKGLAIAHNGSLVGDTQLDKLIKTHNLLHLADQAKFPRDKEEACVLEALTDLGTWAGRYPTDIKLEKHLRVEPLSDPHELLGYGADHIAVRRVLARAIDALTVVADSPPGYGCVVIL